MSNFSLKSEILAESYCCCTLEESKCYNIFLCVGNNCTEKEPKIPSGNLMWKTLQSKLRIQVGCKSEISNMRKGKFDWERANWTRSRNYIFLEIEFEVDLAPLEGAAWSWHAAHVARHHPAVVAAAREHRALVPGGMWQRWWGEGLAVWKVSLANTSPEAAIHARVKRDLVTSPLLSFDVVPEVRMTFT